MARIITNSCNFCGTEIEQVTAKLYLAPVLPGKASTSFMSGYSHHADVCDDCVQKEFLPKMTRRQARNGNGKPITRPKPRTKKRKV